MLGATNVCDFAESFVHSWSHISEPGKRTNITIGYGYLRGSPRSGRLVKQLTFPENTGELMA